MHRVLRYSFIILTVLTCVAFGQRSNTPSHCVKAIDSLTNREIYNKVDAEARVLGGVNKLYSELAKVELPKDPEIDQNKISISFIVEANGDITGLRTIGKMRNPQLDKELLKVFQKFKWEPGACSGVKVPTRLVIVMKS